MAFVLKNRIREKTTKTGTGTAYVCGSNVTGFDPFWKIGDGAKTIVRVEDGGSRWEVFVGQYTLSTNTITRLALLSSSNNNAAVNWPAGTKDMAIVPVAERQMRAGTGCTVTDDEATGEQVIDVDTGDALTDALEDGYRLRWDVVEDSLGTHLYPDVVMEDQAETYASEITIDLARDRGDRHTFTLAGNPTLLIEHFALGTSPERPGKLFRIVVTQDASGGRSIDFAGSDQSWVFPDGEPALDARPNATSELEFLVTSVDPPEFTFIRAIHRPRRADDYTEPPSTAAIATTQAGSGTNAVYSVTCEPGERQDLVGNASVSAGNFTITIDGVTTASIAFNADTATIVDALNAALDTASRDFFCITRTSHADRRLSSGDTIGIDVVSIGTDDEDLALMTIDSSGLTGGTYSVAGVSDGSGTTHPHYSGDFTLSVSVNGGGAQTTGTLNNNSSTNADAQTALEALSNVGAGNVSVTIMGSTGTAMEFGWRIAFQGDLAGDNVTVTRTQDPGATNNMRAVKLRTGSGTNEQQSLTITGTPTKGSVVLTVLPGEAEETDVEIPYNASAATAEALINAALGETAVDVTGGPLPATPLVIEYVGDFAATNVPEATVDDTGINGHARLDWSREINYLELKTGTYTPTIDQGDVLPSQTIRAAIENQNVTGTPALNGTDFGDEGAPTLPANSSYDLVELIAIDVSTIAGRTIQTGLTP